ncbi:MAG: hypothetical protein ACPGJV_16080 [Bacteriovoracaceae bacterium]
MTKILVILTGCALFFTSCSTINTRKPSQTTSLTDQEFAKEICIFERNHAKKYKNVQSNDELDKICKI